MNEATDPEMPSPLPDPPPLSPEQLAQLGALFARAIDLHRAGRFEEARFQYEQLCAIVPNDANLLTNLGTLYHDLGDDSKSLELLRRSLALKGDQPTAWNNLGNVCRRLDARGDALACYEYAIRLAPGFGEARNGRGVVLNELGRHAEALAEFQAALGLQPGDASVLYNLGGVLHEMNRLDEALQCYDHAIASHPGYAEAHNNRGLVLDAMDRHAEAIESYRAALASSPGYAEAWNNLGVVCSELGRLDEARSAFAAALALRPDYAEVHHNLSGITSYAADGPHLAGLEARVAAMAAKPAGERVRFQCALGKAREDVGRFDDAFAAYAEGNRLQHALVPYDEAEAESAAARLTQVFADGRFGYSVAPATGRVPVFIVGMPRSGTTLIEQILSADAAVHGAGEVDTLATTIDAIMREDGHDRFADWAAQASAERFLELGRRYLDRIWRLAPDARFIVNKTLDNYFHLGLIRLALPNARVIHSIRDPMDSCFSCYAKLFSGRLDFSYDLETLGRYYVRYFQLMQRWRRVLPANAMLDMRYEDLVADTEGQARRLLDYLELPWNPACLEFHKQARTVRTASLHQVRKPVYTTSVARWKRFEPHLAPLIDIVGAYRNG